MSTGESESGTGPARPAGEESAARRQVRGSTLLMLGRGISLVLNLAVQVLTVRYLTKLHYGAFAYGLAAVDLFAIAAGLGMNKASLRLVAVYHERDELPKIRGALIVMIATLLVVGGGLVALIHGARGLIGESLVSSPLSLTILLTMVVLAPVQALDALTQSVFSIFSKPHLIFFRRHVLGPGLKVVAVLAVILADGSVRMLAIAYVVAGLVGVAIGGALLVHLFREQKLFPKGWRRSLAFPLGEIFGLALPLVLSDLAFVLRSSLVIVFLEYFKDATSVAEFRAVLPLARLNIVIQESFGLLFIPGIARFLARDRRAEAHELHWLTVTWIVVLTYPLFALSFAFAGPLTVAVFGADYASSAPILAMLSLGYLIYSGLGVSGQTLKAGGHMRTVMIIDALSVAVALALNLTLIPSHGAIGAGVAICAGLILHAVALQVGMTLVSGFAAVPAAFLRLCVMSALLTGGLALVQWIWAPPLLVGAALAGGSWLLLLRSNVASLRLLETFPEASRVRFLSRLVGGSQDGSHRKTG